MLASALGARMAGCLDAFWSAASSMKASKRATSMVHIGRTPEHGEGYDLLVDHFAL